MFHEEERMDPYREFIAMETRTKDLLYSKEDLKTNLITEFQNEQQYQYQYAVIYYTDKVDVIELKEPPLTELSDMENILEVRIFGKQGEYYLLRNSDGNFVGREIRDKKQDVSANDKENWEKKEAFDELHKVWKRCYPNQKDKDKVVFVRVRNYFNTEGSLKFCDWRFVNFEVFEETEVRRGEA